MKYTLGIDLGTSATAAATFAAGRAEVLDLGSQGGTMPSLILLREDGEALVGEAAERRASAEPSRLAREFKRRFGDPTPLVLGGTPFGADALVARTWAAVVARATERMGAAPERIALTHPASYGPYKMELLGQAARQAGIERPVFLSEPEAAAIEYANLERIDDDAVIAVYDFGGGTFDATILRKSGSGFAVLGEPEGLERLGGADFDDAVLAYVLDSLRSGGAAIDAGDGATRVALARLREECRLAKEALSEDTDVAIPVMLPALHTQVRLTRPEFESMIRPRLTETTAALARAVRSAGLAMEDIGRVVLVGGSSRIPLVAEMVSAATGRPVSVDVHPKQVVALGAARVAAAQDPAPGVVLTAERQPVALSISEPLPPGPVAELPVPALASPLVNEGAPAARPAQPANSANGRFRGSGRLPWIGGGLVVLAVLSAAAVYGLFGRGGEKALAAQIDDVELVADRYEVSFTTRGFSPDASGNAVAFYWESKGAGSGTAWGSAAGFNGFTPAGRPAPGDRICIVVIRKDGTPIEASGDCHAVAAAPAAATSASPAASSTAAPTATATAADRQARITGITVSNGRYQVAYTTNYATPTGGQHVHFFFNTVPPAQAGIPAAGPWFVYFGPSPFQGYAVAEKPVGATQMCILAANPDHSVQQGTGNCWNLPQ